MLYIILKNRKVLQYNNAENTKEVDGMVLILDGAGRWITKIPISNIERVDAGLPCAVMKSKPAPKRPNYRG